MRNVHLRRFVDSYEVEQGLVLSLFNPHQIIDLIWRRRHESDANVAKEALPQFQDLGRRIARL
jgi:hypothetical protein